MGRHPALLRDYRGLKLRRLGIPGREWAEWLVCEERVYFYATQASDFSRVNDVFGDVQAMTTFGVLAKELSRSFMLRKLLLGQN
jgi:hypothetical protein